MKQKYIVILLLLAGILTVRAQQDGKRWNRHYLDISTGVEVNLSKTDKKIPGTVFQYENNTTISFRYSYFPFRHWGIYAANRFSIPYSGEREFPQFSGYYTKSIYDYNFDTSFATSFGAVYRWESKNFSIRTHLGAGFRDMMLEDYRYHLKDMGSNNVYAVSYWYRGYAWHPSFFVEPGVTLNLKVAKHINFSFDISYVYLPKRYNLYFEMTDSYTTDVMEHYTLKTPVSQYLNIGIGISFLMGYSGRSTR